MRGRNWLLLGVLSLMPMQAWAALYRSDYSGEFGLLNEATANFTVLGNPTGGDPLSGICQDTQGRLWGTHRDSNVTILIQIDPGSGALLDTVGEIEVNSSDLKITDLACQPQTGTIFGLDNNSNLYTIDKTTAVATLVGAVGVERGGLAFAPDGRLFAASVSNELAQLDPATGNTIGMVLDTDRCIDGFVIDPRQLVGYGTECDGDTLYRINLTTGVATDIGQMGDYGADLEFASASSAAPAASHLSLALLAATLAGTGIARMRRRLER